MAIINLAGPQNISMNVSQQNISDDPNAEIYQGLGRLSNNVASVASEFAKRSREIDLSDKMTKSVSELEQKEAEFNNKWFADNGEYSWTDKQGRTFETAKRDFFSTTKEEIGNKLSAIDPTASTMFNEKANQYIGKKLVSDINDKWKYGTSIAKANAAQVFDSIAKTVTSSNIEALPNVWDIHKSKIEDSLSQLEGFSKQEAQVVRDKGMKYLAETVFEKVYENDLRLGTNVVDAYKDIMPISVFLSPEARAYKVQLLKEAELSGTPDYVDMVRRSLAENDFKALSLAKAQLEKRISLGITSIDGYKVQTTLDKIDNKIRASNDFVNVDPESGSISLGDMDLEGTLDAKDMQVIRNAYSEKPMYELWDNLSPEKRIDTYKKIMSLHPQANKHSADELTRKVNDIKSIPLDVGNASKTFQGIDRAKEALPKLIELFNNPEYRPHKSDYAWVSDMYEANANNILFKHIMTPSLAGERGVDYARFHRDNLESIASQISDPALLKTLKENETILGTKYRADKKADAEHTIRAMRAGISKSPEVAALLYGSERIYNLASKAFKSDGTIDEKNLTTLDRAFQSDFASAVAPWNKDASQKLISNLASKYFQSNRNLLESNNPENIAKGLDPLTKLSPEFGGRLLTTMESNGQIKQKDAMQLRAAFVLKDSTNKGLYNDIVAANTGATLRATQTTYFSDKDMKQKFMNMYDLVKKGVDSFYGYSADAQSKEAVAQNITNYVAKYSLDGSVDSQEFATRTIKELLHKEKINLNESDIKGTIKRATPDEDPADVADKLGAKLKTIKSQIIKGQLDIDMSKIPGYQEHMGKYNPKDKMGASIVKDFFVNDNYDITLETPTDSGNGRELILTARDKKSGQKAYIRSKKNQIYSIRAD
jgi:hypothetical protein